MYPETGNRRNNTREKRGKNVFKLFNREYPALYLPTGSQFEPFGFTRRVGEHRHESGNRRERRDFSRFFEKKIINLKNCTRTRRAFVLRFYGKRFFFSLIPSRVALSYTFFLCAHGNPAVKSFSNNKKIRRIPLASVIVNYVLLRTFKYTKRKIFFFLVFI